MGYWTVKEAAVHFGVSETRIRQLLRAGRLQGYRAGPREWRVSWAWNVHFRPGARGPKFGGLARNRPAKREQF